MVKSLALMIVRIAKSARKEGRFDFGFTYFGTLFLFNLVESLFNVFSTFFPTHFLNAFIRYGDATGLTSTNACKACESGKYQALTGQIQEANCIACIVGKFGDENGADASTDCKECLQGRYGVIFLIFFVF